MIVIFNIYKVADKDGITPLFLANMRGYTKCVKPLKNLESVQSQCKETMIIEVKNEHNTEA